MRHLLLLFVFSVFLSPALFAQEPSGKISCYAYRDDNTPHKKKLWDGYEISLGPVAHPETSEFQCTAAIYNKAGRVVFRTNGFNVVFDEDLTGEDFDGDGKPEVVFRTDTGGGNHCCWGYIIFSLSPKPHKLFEVAMEGKVDFEKDKNGKMLIWQRTSAPAAFITTMADRPFAEKISRWQEGKLVDVTPEFCGTQDSRLERGKLTAEDRKSLENADKPGVDAEDTVSTFLSRTAQHVFCREFDDALKDLDLWPSDKRAAVMKSFADSLGQDYPEFVARLRERISKN